MKMDAFRSDTVKHQALLEQAHRFCAELLAHPVLSRYRDEISIVLKGSTAHGYSDGYSDVDLVVFCHEAQLQAITDEYVQLGLSQRTDGVFLPLQDWAGHYNTDSYEKLAKACTQGRAYHLWEYSGSKPLHDPQGRFAAIVQAGVAHFRQALPTLIKASYLDCQLNLDWLRQPLRRADYGAAFLYTSSVYAAVCQTIFLLQEKPYPCDKWLPYYFSQLDIAEPLKGKVQALPQVFAQMQAAFSADLELMEYPVYREGLEIMEELKKMLKAQYGSLPWIEEWYLYA